MLTGQPAEKVVELNENADDHRQAIHEITRNHSDQALCFVPFRVISWIALSTHYELAGLT
jgi:hypothetical protein